MKLKPLYEVKLIADGKQHFYQIGDDETYHPGATTALGMINKPALIPWAVKACSDNIKEELMKHWAKTGTEKQEKQHLTKEEIEKICTEGKSIYKTKASTAADLGTRVHQAVDCLIRGETPNITKDIEAGVKGFIDWRSSNSLNIELGDTKLGSKVFGYGGSLDFVAFKGNEPVIFDLKTTKKKQGADHGCYSEYAYQLASYAQAFYETYGLEVKEVYCLWVNKEKPEFKAVRISNLSEAFQGFLAALRLYKLSKYEMFDK